MLTDNSLVPTNPLIDIDPKMVVEIAHGMEPADEIATRYGLTPEQWERLRIYQPFRLQVASKIQELKKGGYTFRMKAAMMVEALLDNIYRQVVNDEVGVTTKLSVAQWLARMADLEPKESRQSAAGGFQINIIMPPEPTPAARPEIDVTPTAVRIE